MSAVTDRLSLYIHSEGISLTKISRDTGIKYQALYSSLADKTRGRDLRDEEFLKVCACIGKDPVDFAKD